MPPSRAYRFAYFAVPMIFCLAVHWLAIRTWFSGDDFAWLGLRFELNTPHDWIDVLFGPRAQGTIRTISERLYFLTFSSLFGLNATPFRLWQFATAFADMALIAWITRRVTGSVLAGFVAPLLWCANAALTISMNWSSAYNEVCCAFFLLLAFYFLLRFIDTGRRLFWIAQWAAFLAGFGALELIVMYPAIAALYTFLCARKHCLRTLWLFVPSALFTAYHFLYIPKTADPKYAMHFDLGVAPMLWHYWAFTTGTARPDLVDWRPLWLGVAVACLALAGVAALLRRSMKLTVFFLGWFVLVLLPVLPLKEHFSEYYATIPAIGIAMLGGLAVALYPRIAVPFLVLCMVLSISDIHVADRFFYERSRRMKKLILGLEADQARFRGKAVLISGVDSELFWSGFFDDPFRLLGLSDVFLTPGNEKMIETHPEWGDISRFVISLDGAVQALHSDRAEVYAMRGDQLSRITNNFRSIAYGQYVAVHRDRVDVGDPLYAALVGDGWYNVENGSRWMGKQASVQMSGPATAGHTLEITGYCPAPVLEAGPLELAVAAAGKRIGSAKLTHAGKFEAAFAIPPEDTGVYAMRVTVEVNRTTRIGADVRPLGVIFGTFTIK